MWRFPLAYHVCKGRLDFLSVEGEPAQFCPDGLLLELRRTPGEGGARYAKQGGSPIVFQEYREKDKQNAKSQNIRPPEQAKVAFAADNPDEAETNDEEGGEAK